MTQQELCAKILQLIEQNKRDITGINPFSMDYVYKVIAMRNAIKELLMQETPEESYEYRKLCDFIEGDIVRLNDKEHKIVQIKREHGYVALYWFTKNGVPQAQVGREYETYLAAKRLAKDEEGQR